MLLLKSLILWSLSSSEAIQAKIKESYKQSRHEDDLNQPLSVQPWGRDGLKRRYWLIEGLDDTHFRLYRESNPALKNITWWSVAGSIPELKAVADKLDEERSTHSKKLSEKINNSIPRFEGSEEVSPTYWSFYHHPYSRDPRNANAGIIALLGRQRSHGQSLVSPFTRAAPVGRS